MRRIILWMYLLLVATPLLVSSCYEREGTIGQSNLQTKPSDQILARVMAYVQAHEQQIDFLTERIFFEQGHEGSACYVSYQYITIKYCP